ncbi:MAG TPA: tetratricopeptide repeat protein, partial [Myxococcota bacterium]|nr:tetratricopeptide repeat protein [Myxococcota bacterium]
ASAADEPGTVAVVQTCVDSELAGVTSRLVPELSNMGVASWRLIGDAPPCNPDEGTQRRATLAAGRAAFDALDVDRAVQVLRTLMGDIEASPRTERDLPTAVEAQMLLAWVAIERHDTTAARGYLEAVCALDPKWHPKATVYPPHVVEELRRTCGGAEPTATIRVEAKAVVRVDKRTCNGPCDMRVPPGRHFVSAEANGIRRDVVITAKARETTNVDLSLVPTTAERLRASWREGQLGDVRLVMTLQEADDVVLVDREGAVMQAMVSRKPFKDIRGPVTLEASNPSLGNERIRSELVELHRLEEQAQPPPPVWKRWWFWTAAGVVVTGAVVGIVAATSDTDKVAVNATLP